MHLDILLSIGTSLDHSTVETSGDQQSASFMPTDIVAIRPEGAQKRKALLRIPQIRSMLDVLLNRADNILNTEMAWNRFIVDILPADDNTQSRYQRLNPVIPYKPPSLDEVGEIEKVQAEVHIAMRRGLNNNRARRVAHRLIASSSTKNH